MKSLFPVSRVYELGTSLINNVYECPSCVSASFRPGGFFSKILKKRPHKEAHTPDNGELTFAQMLNDRPTGGEGK